jgi:glycerol-3-phosphate responsive antiterminator
MNVKGDEQILKEAFEKLLEHIQKVGLVDTSELFHQMEKILKTNADVAYT